MVLLLAFVLQPHCRHTLQYYRFHRHRPHHHHAL
jgi:hypothetical protein